MSTSPEFSGLPPELRQMIWDLVLQDEADNRIVLVHRVTLRVIPSKSLISPVMAVDKESRERALKHYNVKLSISTFPAPSFPATPFSAPYGALSDQMEGWDRVYSETDAERLLHGLSHDTSEGCIYVNLDTDKFLLSFTDILVGPRAHTKGDCVTRLFRFAKAVDAPGPGSTRVYKIQQPYIGPQLSPEHCSKIANVVYCRGHPDYHIKPWPGKIYYPGGTASRLWMTQRFTKLSDPTTDAKFWTLQSRGYGSSAVLIHKVLHEGAKAFNIEEWQAKDDKKDGWRLWKSISPPQSA